MRNNKNSMLKIQFSGLCFIVFAMFLANNPAFAHSPYLPAADANTDLSTAIERISKNEHRHASNTVEWVDYKSQNFDPASIGSRHKPSIRYGFQHIDAIDLNTVMGIVRTVLPGSHNLCNIDVPASVHAVPAKLYKFGSHVPTAKSTTIIKPKQQPTTEELLNLKQQLNDPWGNLDESLG